MNKALLITATALLTILSSCDNNKQASTATNQTKVSTVAIAELDDQQFTELVGKPNADGKTWKFASDKPIMVDFHATWCGPCKKMAPNVQQLADNYAEKITVYKVDVDKAQQTARMFGISSIPTILFLDPVTGKLSAQFGYRDYNDLEGLAKEALSID